MTHEPEPMPQQFIPPQPEMPVRSQRMPSIDDLPQPGRAQWEAHHNPEVQQQNSPEAKRRTLFERLAVFGQSRQEERPAVPVQRPQQSQRPAAPGPVHAEYGPRRAVGGPRIEPQRIAPQARTSEEEQLEIPAFLRRQAN